MDGRVVWKEKLIFEGLGPSGFPVRMDSTPAAENPHSGPSPMELVALSLAACTAIDVISILRKKREQVTAFEVKVHAARSADYPRVFTRGTLDYQVSGRGISKEAVLRSIELSVEKYCPVHAMLSQAFPVDLRYSIYEEDGKGGRRVVAEGTVRPGAMQG